jgi:hypothetical protein
MMPLIMTVRTICGMEGEWESSDSGIVPIYRLPSAEFA